MPIARFDFFLILMYLQNFWAEVKQIRWKPFLIPPEHGIWGFTLESVIMGFFLSYQNHLGMSLGIVFLLLLNPFFKQVFKIFLQDVYHKRTFLRKYLALSISILFSLVYLGIVFSIYQNSLYNFWIWILLGLLLGAFLVYLEVAGYYQNIFLELGSSLIPIFFAISMNSTLEFSSDTILFILILLGFRNVSSIVMTREILAILKNKAEKEIFFWYSLAASIFFSLILYFYFIINLYIFIIMIIYLLAMFVLYYLVNNQIIRRAQTIGWSQIGIGIVYVVLALIFRE